MPLAVSWTGQLWIVTPALIHGFAIQVGKPCLYVPRWNEDGNALGILPRGNPLRLAGFGQLPQPPADPSIVTVHHDDERLIDIAARGSVG